MAKRLTSRNPLAYIGVEPLTPANTTQSKRNPTIDDFKNFEIGDVWVNTEIDEIWMLSSKTSTSGTWIQVGDSGGVGASQFATDAGTAAALGDTINIVGGSLINTDALTPNTVTISLDNGTDGQIIIGATAGSPAYGNLTSTGGTINISEGPNTLNIEADTTGFAENYPTDSGTAQPMGGDLNIIGGGNLNTEGAGNTVTVNITNGTDGQVLIGGGSDAQWGNITSLGGTITVTNGANTINLESTTDGTNTFTTDSGVATQALNNIDIVGANVISTAGATDTVTISLDNGTNGQLLIGGGANPVWANLTSTGATVVITNGANSINLEATGMGGGASTFNTDGAAATEAAGVIIMAGGDHITTSGAGNTVTFDLDNGTNGQLLIGGGAAAAWANLTSTGATITISNGPNSINLEATGGGDAGASEFITDSGTANQSLGEIQILGGSNILTSGAGNTVTVALDSDININSATINDDLVVLDTVTFGGPNFDNGVMQVNGGNVFSDNGTNGEILIGGGTNPQWANITSTDASVVITNGANTIDLSVPGGGGGSSTITQFTSSGTWTKSAGTNFVTIIGWHGGGGGASGGKGTGTASGGGGGGNGSCFYFTIPAVFCGATEPVVVGTGGTGGTAVTLANTKGNDGNPGTESYFGNIRLPIAANGGSATVTGFPSVAPGGQAGQVFTSFNSLQTFVASGEVAPYRPVAIVPGPNQGNSQFSRSGGNGSPTGAGSDAFNLGGNLPGVIYYSYKILAAGGGGGGGATGFSGGNGSRLNALDGVTALIPGATPGSNGVNKPSSGGMIVGGMGGGGGNGHATTPQNGGNGGFPGGGGGGGGMCGNAAAASGAGGNGGDGLVIVIEW